MAIRGETRIALSFAVVLGLVPLAGSGHLSGRSRPADLLLLNAHIVTMDRPQPTAQAMAIQEDRIVWVGRDVEAQRLFPGTSRIIDLRGATVLPGIIDAHTHLISLGESLLRLNLKDVATEEEVVKRVNQKAASTAPNEWILGWGWDEGKWASHYPTNEALNAVSPNNPVYLVGLHGFAAWANRTAMQMAGISKDTKDPENGKILRDEKTGEPTGVLLNRAQELLGSRFLP
jgi:predicted amidohydrolase YtcJ